MYIMVSLFHSLIKNQVKFTITRVKQSYNCLKVKSLVSYRISIINVSNYYCSLSTASSEISHYSRYDVFDHGSGTYRVTFRQLCEEVL